MLEAIIMVCFGIWFVSEYRRLGRKGDAHAAYLQRQAELRAAEEERGVTDRTRQLVRRHMATERARLMQEAP
jgi:hypothetical protein